MIKALAVGTASTFASLAAFGGVLQFTGYEDSTPDDTRTKPVTTITEPTQHTKDTKAVPKCHSEDDSTQPVCHWDAASQGNKVGKSFTVYNYGEKVVYDK